MGWRAFSISVIRLRNFGGGVRRDTHQQLLVKIFPEIFAPKKSTFLYGKLLLDPLHGAYADPTYCRRISD